MPCRLAAGPRPRTVERMPAAALVFAVAWIALFTAHQLGDFWLQTDAMAAVKVQPGWRGRVVCAAHAGVHVLVGAALLAAAARVLDVPVSVHGAAAGLGLVGLTHFAADRRVLIRRLARVSGSGGFVEFGLEDGKATHLGTGAYALDQSWHLVWLFAGALLVAAVR